MGKHSMAGRCIKANLPIAGRRRMENWYCKGSETDKSDMRADIMTADEYDNLNYPSIGKFLGGQQWHHV
jgi:hypothetical protein